MSVATSYKNKTYSSRSQAALAMLADGLPQKEIAKQLGITEQMVSAVKKNAHSSTIASVRRAKKQAQASLEKAKKLMEKARQLSMLTTKIVAEPAKKRGRGRPRIYNV